MRRLTDRVAPLYNNKSSMCHGGSNSYTSRSKKTTYTAPIIDPSTFLYLGKAGEGALRPEIPSEHQLRPVFRRSTKRPKNKIKTDDVIPPISNSPPVQPKMNLDNSYVTMRKAPQHLMNRNMKMANFLYEVYDASGHSSKQ